MAKTKEETLATARAWKARNAERMAETVAAYNRAHRDEQRAYAKAYRLANLETVKAKKAAKYEADGEAERAYSRAWYAENAEAQKKRHAAWLLANPGKRVEYEGNRRARKAKAEGKHTAADIQRIGEAQGWRCHWCRKPTKAKYHVDHLVPISKGGTNWPNNLAITCQTCNQQKHAADPIAFAQRKGLLL